MLYEKSISQPNIFKISEPCWVKMNHIEWKCSCIIMCFMKVNKKYIHISNHKNKQQDERKVEISNLY